MASVHTGRELIPRYNSCVMLYNVAYVYVNILPTMLPTIDCVIAIAYYVMLILLYHVFSLPPSTGPCLLPMLTTSTLNPHRDSTEL